MNLTLLRQDQTFAVTLVASPRRPQFQQTPQ
jgi:hypothetical protein